MKIGVAVFALIFLVFSKVGDSNDLAPNLEMCVADHKAYPGNPTPDNSVPIPESFSSIIRSSPQVFAISSLDGSTVCSDAVWTYEILKMEWLNEPRFFGWSWHGHEAFGFRLVDRVNSGIVIDTGARPIFSPDHKRLVALQVSDSGWGDFEGFAVWAVEADGLEPLSYQASRSNDPPPGPFQSYYADWQIAGWQGDTCINLVATPYDIHPENPMGEEPLSFYSSEEEYWEVKQGTCTDGDAS